MIIEIIIITITLALVEGARVPSLLLLLGPVPVVVVDEAHLLLCLGTVVARVIFSSAHLAPWISFDGTDGGVGLNDLLFGSFFHLLHQEVHLGREHVYFIKGVDTSFLGQEAFLIPSLVYNHLFNEVLGILDFLL